jgi:hypothetical protein
MNLTPNDICGYDNKSKQEINGNEEDENENENEDEDVDIEETENYNPNWTLRKCCSKFLDQLSYIYPIQTLEIIRPHLEENMFNINWNIK